MEKLAYTKSVYCSTNLTVNGKIMFQMLLLLQRRCGRHCIMLLLYFEAFCACVVCIHIIRASM